MSVVSPALLALVLAPLVAPPQAVGRDWPSFRGPSASGIAAGPAAPVSWDLATGENVRWRTAVPGLAHSSPVVWGDALFVTTAVRVDGDSELSSLYGSPGYGAGESVPDEGAHHFQLLCLDKRTGEVRWTRTALTAVPEVRRHPKSSHANPTPACDAAHVVAFFGSEGIFCYDHAGELLWSRDFGVLEAGAPDVPDGSPYQWGFASSPVIHGDRVIVQCDVQAQSFVAALDLETGEELWRTARDEEPTWSTPTVYTSAADGRAQVVLNGYHHVAAYDLETGAEVWSLSGGGDVPVPTPVVAYDLVYLTSAHGRDRPIRAIHADARGVLENSADDERVEWLDNRAGIYMQTPLVHDGILYACSDGGVLAAHDAFTGERLYRERLGDGTAGFSGSAVLSGDALYFTAESGEVLVVRVGPEFERLGVNELGEVCMSTPAVSDGVLYFRTRGHVIAVGATD